MASFNTDTSLTSAVLSRLENLQIDEYIIAFGPHGQQFIGTPNGYSATYLPSKILTELAGYSIKKVLWASFGDAPESWFFAYETRSGAISLRLGEGAPTTLREYIDLISTSEPLLGSLRVQLGSNGSFVVWSKTAWACYNLPRNLRDQLCQLSSVSRELNRITKGSLKRWSISNIQWHKDGSFYLRTYEYNAWHFRTDLMLGAWSTLWQDVEDGIPGSEYMAELAYVAIDAYASTSDTFAFLKKQKTGKEARFILHFGQEPVHARLTSGDRRLLPIIRKARNTHFIWATSRRSGSPHQDAWELDLKKGEKVKVLQDMGRGWFVVEGQKGIKGWVHGSWLNFSSRHLHQDPKAAYEQFSKGMQRRLVPSQLRVFPSMANYIDTCTMTDCRPIKEDGGLTGICVHDLEVLLRGSGCYSYAWLKKQRCFWHPDRFARFCQPDHAGQLKIKAEQLFVLYGLLMQLEKPQ